MSRKTTRSVLSLDEINLLRNSEEPKNEQLYGNLYNVLNSLNSHKALALDEMDSLNDVGKAALTYNKESLIDSVKKEWYTEAVSDIDPKQKIRCGLCNTPNKYLFFIRNRINNNRLNVGSLCMTKFPGIEGYTEYKQQLNHIQKNQKVILRRTEFHAAFPDVQNIIESSSKYFNSLPILLPKDLYYPLKEVVSRIEIIYNQYVIHGKKPFETTFGSLKLFQLAIDQYNKLKQQANKFVQENISDPFVCKRAEIDWLISNNKEYLINEISSNNGRYTKLTISNIYSYEFIRNNFEIFTSKNTATQLKISMPADKFETNIYVSFNKIGYNPSVAFKIRFEDFMLKIGGQSLFDEQFIYSGKEILSISSVVNSRANLESVLAYIANIMNRLNYIFLFDDRTNYLYLFRKADCAISRIEPNTFLRSYSKYILDSDETIKKYLLYMVSNIKKTSWTSKEQQGINGLYDKISKLYKEQYESSNLYETKNSNAQTNYLEIPVYHNKRVSTNKSKIDFFKPEYVKIHKSKLNMKPNKYRFIDYAIVNVCDNMLPWFENGDLLLIQSKAKLRDDDIALIAADGICHIGKYRGMPILKAIILNLNMPDEISIDTNDIAYSGKIIGHIKI